MDTFSEPVLRGMTDEELLREQPCELVCKILMERVESLLEGEEENETLLSEIGNLLDEENEEEKLASQTYRELIEALEKLHNQYS